MKETVNPRFKWGQRVQTATDLYNDGSYPECPAEALLVAAGEAGEIVRIGQHVDSGTVVYMVDFASKLVVGCIEPELISL